MSLVIDDAHIGAVKQHLMNQSNSLDSLISRYVRTMGNVVEAGFMEGTTAKALKELLKQVESNVSSKGANPGEMESQVERYCINFITTVDKADKALY